jgi:hypothetical protein
MSEFLSIINVSGRRALWYFKDLHVGLHAALKLAMRSLRILVSSAGLTFAADLRANTKETSKVNKQKQQVEKT